MRPLSVPELPESQLRSGWWPRLQRYAERLVSGTKTADVIGESAQGLATPPRRRAARF